MKYFWLPILPVLLLCSCENKERIRESLESQEQRIRNLPDTSSYDVVIEQVRALSDSINFLAIKHDDEFIREMQISVMNWENSLNSEKKDYWEIQSCFRSVFRDSIDARNCMQGLQKKISQYPDALKMRTFQDSYDAAATAYIALFCDKRIFHSLGEINSGISSCNNLASSIKSVFKRQQTNGPITSLYLQRKKLFAREYEYKLAGLEVAMADSVKRYFMANEPDLEIIGTTEDITADPENESIYLPAPVERNYTIIAIKNNLFLSEKVTCAIKITGEITGSEQSGLSWEIKQITKGITTGYE
jgi:hypothetical protein